MTHHPDRLRADAGAVTLEGAIMAPVVILATMIIVRAACYFMANTTATNAAQISAETARVRRASDADGMRAGRDYLGDIDAMAQASISVTGSGGTVTATVTAPAPAIVPIVPMPDVRSEINVPVGRVTRP
ncbi:pilus assembly protein [Janibacter limosus]|uniref:TadE/TadG family type IV pilus assembly protein n=1 Tax=Janibacter limosus TaxID=53458 RepID=UPI0035D89BAB|nr:pilus assembly protein [Janibacter limosus]